MRVFIQLGKRFSAEAGFAERAFEVPQGATAFRLLREIAAAAPRLSCLDESGASVDLALANLSVNGKAVDPRSPEKFALQEGDRCYLYGIIGGG